ncbi:hypothetical protein D3C76_1217550 [compost metagenome]
MIGVSTGAISRRPGAEKQLRAISRYMLPSHHLCALKALAVAVVVTSRTISTITDTDWWTKSNCGRPLPCTASSSGRRTLESSSRTGRICRRPWGVMHRPMKIA